METPVLTLLCILLTISNGEAWINSYAATANSYYTGSRATVTHYYTKAKQYYNTARQYYDEAKSYNPGTYNQNSRYPTAQQEEDGKCSEFTIDRINGSMDSECMENLQLLEQLEAEIATRTNSTHPPTEDQLDQLTHLAERVCSNTCAGVKYKLFKLCFPDDKDRKTEVSIITNHCGSNGEIFCGLAPVFIQNREAYDKSMACILEYLHSPYNCSASCRDAFNSVISEIGCCANNDFGLYFTFLSNSTIQDYYSVCEIPDPGFCDNPFLIYQILAVLANNSYLTFLLSAIIVASILGGCVYFYVRICMYYRSCRQPPKTYF